LIVAHRSDGAGLRPIGDCADGRGFGAAIDRLISLGRPGQANAIVQPAVVAREGEAPQAPPAVTVLCAANLSLCVDSIEPAPSERSRCGSFASVVLMNNAERLVLE
jgi:hypothetical protein